MGISRTCEITLMGGFRVRVDGGAIPDEAWRRRRAAELIKILALERAGRLHREQIMDALWPRLPPEAAAANLRKAVHFARRAIGSDHAVVTGSGMVELWPGGGISVDATRFEDKARAALRSHDRAAAAEAATLYRGELLPEDRYASWADQPRERLRLLAVRVLKAASEWERVLEIDPADEEAHRELMARALAAGDRTGAIRQFERLRERLRIDLAMGPDEASVALYETALTSGEAGPPSVAGRVRALLGWGAVHLNAGDLDEAEMNAEQARRLALDSGLTREIGEASALLGIVANTRGQWRGMFLAEFVDVIRRSGEIAASVFDAHLCIAEFSLYGSSGPEEISEYARQLLEVAEETDSVQGHALAELLLGEADLISDHLEPAEGHLRASVVLHEQVGAVAGQVIAIQRLAESAVANGQRRRAGQLLRKGLRLAESSQMAPHLMVRMHEGLVAAAQGAAVLTAIREGEAALTGQVVCPPCSIGFRVAVAKAFANNGDIDLAQKRLDEAERIVGMWSSGPWHAAVWEARGVLRRAQGNEDEAAATFREAAERFADAGWPRDEARCRAYSEATGLASVMM